MQRLARIGAGAGAATVGVRLSAAIESPIRFTREERIAPLRPYDVRETGYRKNNASRTRARFRGAFRRTFGGIDSSIDERVSFHDRP